MNTDWKMLPESFRRQVEAQLYPKAAYPASTTKLPPHPGVIQAVKEGPVLNKTETRFLAILRQRHPAPAVIRVMPMRFILGHDNTYNPDFMVSDGPILKIIFYETKGAHIWAKNIIKFKTAARMFPEFTWILAQWKDGTWTETQYK